MPNGPQWRAWLREPLLHFFVLGAVLFAADAVFAVRSDDPYTITLDASPDESAQEAFRQEVLYREGIAMQIDKGDRLIRDRVIFKMLGLIEAGLSPPTFDETALREWFEANRAKYDQPGMPAEFDQVASIVLQDWIDAKLADQRSAAILAMEKRYTLKVTGARPADVQAQE